MGQLNQGVEEGWKRGLIVYRVHVDIKTQYKNIYTRTRTLKNKGSKQGSSEGLWFYRALFTSEGSSFEERVLRETRGSIKNPFNPFWKKKQFLKHP